MRRATRPGRRLAAMLPPVFVLFLATAAALPSQAPAPAAAAWPTAQTPPSAVLPRVRLVATGGTIANRAGGRLTADDLARLVPPRHARLEAEQFSNVASGQLTLEQWVALARRLTEIFQSDAELAGIVVTSGTDTLEELAWFLHLTVRSERPVVVVGSMRRPETPGYDGGANLIAAVRVAAEPASRQRGTLVVLNDEIESARDVTKADAQRLETFTSGPYGTLGVVDSDRIVYHRRPERRHTAASEFDPYVIDTLPRVDVLLTYQGAPGDLLHAAVDAGARGLVLATAAGGTSGTQNEGIRYATSKRVVVVRATRTGRGRAIPGRQAPDADSSLTGTVAAEDLAPIKARVLLMLALTRTSDPREIQRMFSEY